jgi:hypothetical protein
MYHAMFMLPYYGYATMSMLSYYDLKPSWYEDYVLGYHDYAMVMFMDRGSCVLWYACHVIMVSYDDHAIMRCYVHHVTMLWLYVMVHASCYDHAMIIMYHHGSWISCTMRYCIMLFRILLVCSANPLPLSLLLALGLLEYSFRGISDILGPAGRFPSLSLSVSDSTGMRI